MEPGLVFIIFRYDHLILKKCIMKNGNIYLISVIDNIDIVLCDDLKINNSGDLTFSFNMYFKIL